MYGDVRENIQQLFKPKGGGIPKHTHDGYKKR